MAHLSLIWTTILGVTRIAARDVTRLWTRVVLFAIVMIALVFIQVPINIFVSPALNYVFLFGGTLLLLLLGLSPAGFAVGAGTGTVFAVLNDRDISQGTYRGLVLTYRVTIHVVFWWVIVSGFLATWSLERAPLAIFPIAGACLVLLVATAYFEMRANVILKPVVLVYATVVLLLGVWQTLPLEWRPFQNFDIVTGESGRMIGIRTGESWRMDPKWCAEQPNGCKSPTTGEKLRPMTPEDVLRKQRTSPGNSGGVLKKVADERLGFGSYSLELSRGESTPKLCTPGHSNIEFQRESPNMKLIYWITPPGGSSEIRVRQPAGPNVSLPANRCVRIEAGDTGVRMTFSVTQV